MIARFSTIPAILLLTAGSSSKLIGLRYGFDETVFGIHSTILVTLIATFEILLATWLFSRWHFRLALKATFVVFTIFLFVALVKTVRGYDSCGCFGPFTIPPLWTAAIDVIVIFAISSCPQTALVRTKRRVVASALGFLLFVAVANFVVIFTMGSPVALTGKIEPGGTKKVVIIEPERFIGQKFPLLKFLDNPKLLTTGTWRILLVRNDCKLCEQKLSLWSAERKLRENVVIIELPSNVARRFSYPSYATVFRIHDTRTWFAQLPIEIILIDGIVKGYSESGSPLIHQ